MTRCTCAWDICADPETGAVRVDRVAEYDPHCPYPLHRLEAEYAAEEFA